MNVNSIINALAKKNNGSFFHVEWTSTVTKITAAAKRNGIVVTKKTSGSVRKGIDYKNQKKIIAKVENEGYELTHTLKWGEWMTSYESRPVQNNVYIAHKGLVYIRLYPNPLVKFKSQYFVNGEPVDVNTLKNMGIIQNSYWDGNSQDANALTIRAENIDVIR